MRRLETSEEYVDWRDSHPGGFVLNTYQRPTSSYLMLHRATCWWMTHLQADAISWTKDYAKFGGERRELERYAVAVIGGVVSPCGHCLR